MLKVRDLKFTHDTVFRQFQDGSSFDSLKRDLRSGRVDPQVHLKPLKVYHWPGRGYYSRDNRRLKCLKEYQEEVDKRNVFVRLLGIVSFHGRGDAHCTMPWSGNPWIAFIPFSSVSRTLSSEQSRGKTQHL